MCNLSIMELCHDCKQVTSQSLYYVMIVHVHHCAHGFMQWLYGEPVLVRWMCGDIDVLVHTTTGHTYTCINGVGCMVPLWLQCVWMRCRCCCVITARCCVCVCTDCDCIDVDDVWWRRFGRCDDTMMIDNYTNNDDDARDVFVISGHQAACAIVVSRSLETADCKQNAVCSTCSSCRLCGGIRCLTLTGIGIM